MSALTTPALVSVDEYLRTSYRPDCDYIDGQIEERCLGEFNHSQAQLFLSLLFGNNAKAWAIRVAPEYRIQVAATRFRVPDITVIRAGEPKQSILRTPPMLIVEILSPEDTLSRLQQRVTDYLRFGVEHIWVIDPEAHLAYLADATGFHEPAGGSAQAVLAVPGTPIAVPLAELWAHLESA